MGTSSSYEGPKGGTPLVPTWLEPATSGEPGASSDTSADGATAPLAPSPSSPTPPPPPERLTPQPVSMPGRFTAARNNFSRFARSGGGDRSNLGRAISGYVAQASGGAGQAARRMGTSRAAGARLLGFLTDAQARGTRAALRALDLDSLAGRPVEEIFLSLADYICPEAGTVDEAIARDAFIETIADIASLGIADLDALTTDQMQTVFEIYATHTIEARICNDIGMKLVTFPANVRSAERVQSQLRDFIQRGVSDALTAARGAMATLTPERVLSFVGDVYEAAFGILQTLGDAEAEAT